MRTTIDLPDDLHRQAKAEAALRGMKFREYVAALFKQGLDKPAPTSNGRRHPMPAPIPKGRLSFPENMTNADIFEALGREDDERMDEVNRAFDARSA